MARYCPLQVVEILLVTPPGQVVQVLLARLCAEPLLLLAALEELGRGVQLVQEVAGAQDHLTEMAGQEETAVALIQPGAVAVLEVTEGLVAQPVLAVEAGEEFLQEVTGPPMRLEAEAEVRPLVLQQ